MLAFDKIVIHHNCNKIIKSVTENGISYKNEIIYLPYEVKEKDTANLLTKTINKNELVWDFSIRCLASLKKQIVTMINSILREYKVHHEQRIFLLALKRLYEYCFTNRIYNLMRMEKYEENRFLLFLNKDSKLKKYAGKIISYCRKNLFLQSKKIDWEANVWYIDRFHLDESRLNLSCPIDILSFLAIDNLKNKQLVQKYIKYMIGVTDFSVNTIRNKLGVLKEYIIGLSDKSILESDTYDFDSYFNKIQSKENNPITINRKIMTVTGLYQYLVVHGLIQQVPYNPSYYFLKCDYYTHNDRAISNKVIKLIVENLAQCREDLRLMFLLLICTGRRKSEICQIKKNDLYREKDVCWIKFYQPKMASDILVPIPERLYEILDVYKNGVDRSEYMFINSNGFPYNSLTFSVEMVRFCRNIGCEDIGYSFKAHDFRHTIATYLYETGASIQSIREFLGHKSDEMTKKYIDYIPKQIEVKSRELFQRRKHK